MIRFRYIRRFLCGMALCATLPLLASGPDRWRERVMKVCGDPTLSDSMKVVRIADITYDYSYIYRSIDEEQVQEFLAVTLPLADRLATDDAKIAIYSTAIFMGSPAKRSKEIAQTCLHFTRRGVTPEARFQGWIRLGQLNMNNSLVLKYTLRALAEMEGSDNWSLLAQACRYISVYYREQMDFTNSLKYARRSLEYALRSGDPRSQALSWREMAYIYYETPDKLHWKEASEAFDRAVRIFREQILPHEDDPDKSYTDRLHFMVTLVNMGVIDYDRDNLFDAEKHLSEALETAVPNRMHETAAFCYKQLGLIAWRRKEWKKAERYYDAAERMLAENGYRTSESDYLQYEILLAKATLYDRTGDYRRSAEAWRDGIAKYRAVFDEQTRLKNQTLAASYENARQEEELKRMETIVAYRQRQWWFAAGITLLLLAVLVFTLWIYRYKIVVAHQREQRLKDGTRKLELEKTKAELTVRLKLEQIEELKDKLCRGNKSVARRNAVLNNLKAFFSAHAELTPYKSRIEAVLMQQNRVENNVNGFRSGMRDVPPDFYERLQKRAAGRLTPLDMKYCRLIYLNTPTREMARQLYVEPRSIGVNKHRLKRKLGVDRNVDLGAFIRGEATEQN